ncbi:MAG: protein-glutamate O-methyltransferase CheR, partial [Pseudomonadota bacterium]
MKDADFQLYADLLKTRSGLVIGPDKVYLLESRLLPIARREELGDLSGLADAIRTKRPEALIAAVTEAMTTNESFFFRDIRPFDQFRDHVLPAVMSARNAHKKIRIWSAACSSGQEPYSLAMILKELGPKVAGWTFEIVATDLSAQMVRRAKEGVYTQFEVQRGLPITMLVKYFKQEGDKWRITDDIRRMVTYREFNLLGDYSGLGQFDIVFCRNVLIYFDQTTKGEVL